MSHTFYVYETIWQTAEMGQQTLRHMICRSHDAAFVRLMCGQLRAYRAVGRSARRALGRVGLCPRPIGCMQRWMTEMGLRCNLCIDRTPSHMAEMLMQGNAMGIIAVQKVLRARPHAAQSAVETAERMQDVLCKAFDDLSAFL